MKPPKKYRYKYKDNIRKTFKQTGHKSVDRIQQILNDCLKGMGYFASSWRKVNFIKIILPTEKVTYVACLSAQQNKIHKFTNEFNS